MTRLKESDICHISSRLEAYNQELMAKTGRTLLGVACHSCNLNENNIKSKSKSFLIHVVPVTAGQGIISDFSQTVTSILKFLGFNAVVSDKSDVSGMVMAFENKADGIMMADDYKFVGINLKTGFVADNSEVTGRVFAAALDLMAKGIKDNDVLVLGCGPVGEAAACKLLSLGAKVVLYDIHFDSVRSLQEKLSSSFDKGRIRIEKNINIGLSNHQYILEATPSSGTIPDELISEHMRVAAPGVPLGISDNACQILKTGFVHDKLELGVAAMAISLLS